METLYLVSETFEVVSDESAENGDFEETGYNFQNEPMSVHEIADHLKNNGFIFPSCSHYSKNIWFSTEGEIDYITGEYTTKNLHFDVPERLLKAICKYVEIKLIFKEK